MSEIELVSAALVAAQAELGPVPFDSRNPYYGSDYASLGAMIETARPVLSKHGLAVAQIVTGNQDEITVTTTVIHKSGQSMPLGAMTWKLGTQEEELDKFGKPRKVNRLQKFGQAVTYLRRYTYAPPLGLYGEADDDAQGEPSERPQGHSRHATPRIHAPEPPEAAQANSDAGKGILEATPAFRMRALHRLKAAAGEENRAVVAHFLKVRGWIKGDQHPEDWDLQHVPKNLAELTALGAEISQFAEEQMRLQNPPQGAE